MDITANHGIKRERERERGLFAVGMLQYQVYSHHLANDDYVVRHYRTITLMCAFGERPPAAEMLN